MLINRVGATRIVIVLKSAVIKIPNFLHSWQTFIRGLLSNIDESQTWRFNSGKYESGKSQYLCPILFTSWGGWIIIMKRVDKVLTHEDFWGLDESILAPHLEHFNGDDCGPNYGWLSGRLVKIDYAQLKI